MVTARRSALNRKQRKDLARRLWTQDPGLDIVHPHAAGIDVGNSTHYVAVRPDRDPDSVRRFECFTADLHRLADWLQHCGVTTVAMQSTGVYWIPVYEILDARGIEVYLVNARHTKNLPGRKTDVQESQWLLKLHTYGLLRNSFHPSAAIRVVRTYWRQRGDHVQAVSTCIQRMQKVLTQMNIQLANVISDLSGWTGQRIVRAMLDGERDPAALAALSHPGIHATRDTIAKSLEGTWQPDLLFVLRQEVAMYDAYQQRIVECDHELEQHLKRFADKVTDALPAGEPSATTGARLRSGPKRRRKAGSHAPQFDLGRELHRISGVDLTRIDGIDVGVAQTVISEVGLDMTRWKTEAHFASWLGLCPDNRITGGKVIRKGTRHVVNRAATALRLAATTLLRSQSYLGGQYRRLRAKLGAPKAITAMAHKLARLVYRMLKWGHEYVDKGLQYYEDRHREQQVHLLKKRAARLGLKIVEPDAA
ncbi:MAG TPA: IS110 family transposase [Vicinamibacterales bacterium]|nr:IS110 family transposase [Vicinamibacterales bacterium]